MRDVALRTSAWERDWCGICILSRIPSLYDFPCQQSFKRRAFLNATYYGGHKFLFSFLTCWSLYRQENSPTNDILTELDKSPLLSAGNVIVKACEKCSQREATTRVEFVTLLLKEVSFLWSSITVTLTFTNVALNQCTTCMLECVLCVHPEFKILSLFIYLFIYLFIHLFIIYLQGLNHLLESRTFTFVMSSLTQNKMTTEFYEVSS